MIYNYTIPIVYTPEDNDSFINKTSILFKSPSDFPTVTNNLNGYNCNKCPNDNAYCQPFVVGDLIQFQLPLNVNTYFAAYPEVIDSSTGLPIAVPISIEGGLSSNRTTFANYTVDTSNILLSTVKCWYLNIKLFKCYLDPNEVYQGCVYYKIQGGTPAAIARAECYNDLCEDFDFITSEPYCAVGCNEMTLLITGFYIDKDCNGAYYGAFDTGANNYQPSVRVRGVIESDGFEFEKTVNVLKTVKSQQTQRFILYTAPVPYYVAQQIAVCFNSQELKIDGNIYTGALKLNKNFDEGSNWIIKENIYQSCNEINFTCD